MTKATICLAMIVKDEGEIIYDTLDALYKKIKFDFWIICDTGSTDNTFEEIKRFFTKTRYKGKLFIKEWQDFAHNRTEALALAKNHTDYVLMFDADDRIEGNIIIPKYKKKSGYTLNFSDENIQWKRVALLDNRMEWYFKGVVHEFVTTDEKNIHRCHLDGDYSIKTNVVVSARNKQKFGNNKFVDDAKLMEKAYETETDEKMKSRYAFYCGKNYQNTNMFNKSIKWYKERLKYRNNHNELWITCYRLAFQYKRQKNTNLYKKYLLNCFHYDDTRFENLYYIIDEEFRDTNYLSALKYLLFIKKTYTLENIYKKNLFKENKIIYNDFPMLILKIIDKCVDIIFLDVDERPINMTYISNDTLIDLFQQTHSIFLNSVIVFLNKNNSYKSSSERSSWEFLPFKEINVILERLNKFIEMSNTFNLNVEFLPLKEHYKKFVNYNKDNLRKNKEICLTVKKTYELFPVEDEKVIKEEREDRMDRMDRMDREEENKITQQLKIETSEIGIQTERQNIDTIDNINLDFLKQHINGEKDMDMENLQHIIQEKNILEQKLKEINKMMTGKIFKPAGIDKYSQTELSSQYIQKKMFFQ